MALAPKPSVNILFWDDRLFDNPDFLDFYRRLHHAPLELFNSIYHFTWDALDEFKRSKVYDNGRYSALLYSCMRRLYQPRIAKGLAADQVAAFMKNVDKASAIYALEFMPSRATDNLGTAIKSPVATNADETDPPLSRYKPSTRIYTFGNIVQLDVDLRLLSDLFIARPIRDMLLLDLTLRCSPEMGTQIIPLLVSFNPKESILRKLRLMTVPNVYQAYAHHPSDIYWDHPLFRRTVRDFAALRVFALSHPAYIVPIRNPCWSNEDDEDGENSDTDDEPGEGTSEAEADEESVGEVSRNDKFDSEDEDLFEERQCFRRLQEAQYGWYRRNRVLVDADWEKEEILFIEDLASPTLTTVFLVFAYDEATQVQGDFSLDNEYGSITDGRFSCFTRGEHGQWTRRRNTFMDGGGFSRRPLRLREDRVDLTLSGMRFSEDCWGLFTYRTVALSEQEYAALLL
ncbi:hypothetical protein BDZ89DRAFT_1142103 [Hymenopellis radicata]|nr:hypothetical protein BDZ89DRAFT_1142103 [Hymenopellis radicata]